MRFLVPLLILGPVFSGADQPEKEFPFERPHVHGSIESLVHVGWESRYLSEGRDSLDGDSLLLSSVELGWNHLTAGLWVGESPDQDYDEWQLSLGVSETFGDLEIYAAYTHLQFPHSDEHDNELGVGLSWEGLPLEFVCSADAYYSFESEGSFWEFALSREIANVDRLHFDGSILLGVNQGYVPDGHDGANNLAAQIQVEFEITESLLLIGHVTHNWAVDQQPALAGDEQLVDFSHMGFVLHWAY